MKKREENASSTMTSPGRRQKRRKKRKRDLFDIPGVRKIIMSELTQKIIECVVGEHVTSENPWKYVKKELVQDNLELHEESSEFLPVKTEILAYSRPEILIGYIADETQDKDDEFYICLTEEATDTVQKIIEKLQQEQEDRLYYQLYKDIHAWQSMGTEEEVDECIVKNNRPLLEVEVESQYPIFPGKVQFRLVPAENRRDGYMELRCPPEENLTCVYMKRIDNGVQVAPALRGSEAQTICTYPRNAATQYLYDVGETGHLLTQCEPQIIKYANENIEDVSDLLKVNGAIDFYANDFESLVKNEALTSNADGTGSSREFMEYLSFMDVNLCKGKMISDVHWHPMWSGTVAIAYCRSSSNIYYTGLNKEDVVFKSVHTPNIVLIWSFLDFLKPKLILETPREVSRLSFCKFDENILIGGCKNGQIIIWDIRNKLQKVEEKEALTVAQQKYRSYMHSLMGWMKNTHDVALVRPAAISDLRYSHTAGITGISWLDPHYEFGRTGKLMDLLEEDSENRPKKLSMQLLTSSLDGSVLIWDLKDKPTIQPGGYKPKRLRRLKKRPSALEMDVSPYRILHLNLKPRYKINVYIRNQKNKAVSITRCSAGFCWLKYEEVEPAQNKKFDIKERMIYRPIMTKRADLKPHLRLGTEDGNFAEIEWEGQDFDSGEVVNSESAKYIQDSKYHDGPISTIHRSQADNCILSVGGKIFALWRADLPGRPILWRRSRQFYTRGELNIFTPFEITLLSASGSLTKWILPVNSKSPVFSQMMSNGFLTASGLHPFQREKIVYGLGDEQGAFRLFYVKQPSSSFADNVTKAMRNFVDREINRKNLFSNWQNEFNERNKSDLQRMKQEAEQKAKEEAEKEASKEEPKAPEKISRKGPQPGKFVEWIIEQRHVKEQARIKAMIINKKQLDTKELEKRRKPLQKLDEENERKKRKQKERLKQGDAIFRDTVASLFPDALKEKPIPPPDPYATGNSPEVQMECYSQYDDLMEQLDGFIKANPLQYDFSFKNLIVRSKCKGNNAFDTHLHVKRFEIEKKARLGTKLAAHVAQDEALLEDEVSVIDEEEIAEELEAI